MRITNVLKSTLVFVICVNAQAFVYSFNQSGDKITWAENISRITMNLDPSSNLQISESDIISIAETSINEWNNKSRLTFKVKNSPESRQNRIFFSNDPRVFNGSGIVGLTQLAYSASSGNIVSADVLINDAFNLTNNPEDEFYLGNVLTHEFGHVLGLGHGDVHDATMFYLLDKHQSTLADDDISGIFNLYPTIEKFKSIKGTVVGSNKLIGVFGAHVQAVSAKYNKIVSSVYSDADGNFEIPRLDSNDAYFIVVSPAKNISMMPTYYGSVRADFCSDGKSYVTSAFQSCEKSYQGYPQVISTDSSQAVIDVGNISISCGQKIPTFERNRFEDIILKSKYAPMVLTNHMSKKMISEYLSEQYYLDLTDSPVKDEIAKITVGLMSSVVYFPTQYELNVTSTETEITKTKRHIKDEADVVQFSYREKNYGNIFEIEVSPIEYIQNDEFVDSKFVEPSSYYFLNVTLLDKNDKVIVYNRSRSLVDNSSCADGAKTYQVLPNLDSSNTDAKLTSKDDQTVSCATIDDNSSNGPPTMFSFIIGVVVVLLLVRFKQNVVFEKIS